MSFAQIIIRIIANTVFLLKKEEIKNANSKFLIFTGTSGKTTMKDTVYTTLHGLNIPVEKSIYGYNNELGILLTVLDAQNFSIKNPKDWLKLLKKKVIKNRFICIELGADFYKDTDWFLNKFSPYGIFISASDGSSWSRDIFKVRKDRRKLFSSIRSDGFVVYNLDNTEIKKLIEESSIKAKLLPFSSKTKSDTFIFLESWKNPFATLPIDKALNTEDNLIISVDKKYHTIKMRKALFEPQVYSILATYACIYFISPKDTEYVENIIKGYNFSVDRLQMYVAKNGALIIEDSYKATPLCTYWFLDMSSVLIANRKILVVTEMRPLTFNTDYFYSKLAGKINFTDQNYFIGPQKYFNILDKINIHIKHVNKKDYSDVANDILSHSTKGDLILFKGSFRYQLNEIRNLLI